MFRKLLYFPNGMPLFGTIVAIVGYLAMGFSAFVVQQTAGRPYSTSGIAVITIPIIAAVLGAFGFMAGWVVRLIVSPVLPARVAQARHWTLPILIVLTAVAAGYKGSSNVLDYENAARPEVITNVAGIRKGHSNLAQYEVVSAVRVLDTLAGLKNELDWAGSKISFVESGNVLQLRFGVESQSLDIPITGLDYINFIDAAPLAIGADRNPVLALVVTGRATGGRAMIAVVSESHQLVYLERLEPFWDIRATAFAVATSPSGDGIVVGWGSPNYFTIGLPDAT